MKKLLIMLLLLFIFSKSLSSENLFVLKDVIKPEKIAVFKNRLYEVDNTNIRIYSLENSKLENQFGRRGEGQGE